MRYLLDTNMLIYWMKGTPQVIAQVAHHTAKNLSASVISKAELFFGAYNSQYIDKNLNAVKKLAKTIQFAPLDDTAQEIFGKMKADLQRRGAIIDDCDIFIAATAFSQNCTVATNNIKHFSRIPGLKIENWLEAK
jgi:tRNA(fMet)-specific endonuclease VapC